MIQGFSLVSIALVASAFSSASISPLVAQPVKPIAPVLPDVPSPTVPERSPEEMLAISVRNLFELIVKPDPRYAALVRINSRTRLLVVKTDVGGSATVSGEFQGKEQIELALTKAFAATPDEAVFEFGEPKITIDGAYGRAVMRVAIRPALGSPESFKIYVDALQDEQRQWGTFTQIVILSHHRWWRGERNGFGTRSHGLPKGNLN
jgi:hypothetical protein